MIELTDDGTLDTVLRCSDCGEEIRYSYDGGEEESRLELEREQAIKHPSWRNEQVIDAVNDQLYSEFIDWAIEDATADHECGQEDN